MWDGNLSNIDTTGASSLTARADGRTSTGVRASQEMAESDLHHVNQHKTKIISAARRNEVDPSLVAAIISRETRGGRGAGLQNGWGDNGNAFGLMQVDKNHHIPRGQATSEEHISQGIEILKGCSSDIGRKFPSWNSDQNLKGALAAYNMGAERVSSYANVDANTTGNDYANDVLARAQYFKQNGYN